MPVESQALLAVPNVNSGHFPNDDWVELIPKGENG